MFSVFGYAFGFWYFGMLSVIWYVFGISVLLQEMAWVREAMGASLKEFQWRVGGFVYVWNGRWRLGRVVDV